MRDIFAVLISGLVVTACAKPDRGTTTRAQDSAKAVETADTSSTASAIPLNTRGPRLVVDSSGSSPHLELRNEEFVLHLPAAMARVLTDNLPGFTPTQRSAIDTALVSWVDHRIDRAIPTIGEPDSDLVFASAMSVAVGDFNGDGRPDVAMEGTAGDSVAAFFLLASPDSGSIPQLIYMYPTQKAWNFEPSINYMTLVRPGKLHGFEEVEGPEPLTLRTDAIEWAAFGKASEIYFLEGGVLKRFTTSD